MRLPKSGITRSLSTRALNRHIVHENLAPVAVSMRTTWEIGTDSWAELMSGKSAMSKSGPRLERRCLETPAVREQWSLSDHRRQRGYARTWLNSERM
jgi:hypothetical protein